MQLNGQGKRSVRLVEGKIQDPDAVRALVQGTDGLICCTGGRRGPDGYAPGASPEVSCLTLLNSLGNRRTTQWDRCASIWGS